MPEIEESSSEEIDVDFGLIDRAYRNTAKNILGVLAKSSTFLL